MTILAASLWLALAATSPAAPGPTLAREDTMHTEVPEVLVTAPRVTLDEILDRVARGEARRESLMTDQSFTATLRVVRGAQKEKPASLIAESVTRVFKKRPDKVRWVLLRQWTQKSEKNKKKKVDAGITVSFRPNMSEEIVNFAFRPEGRRSFKYHIVGRQIVGNHLIYRIAFEPRSPLDPTEPSGLVWVDTNDFVIVRQEVSFDRSPVPLFLKGVDRMVIERQKADGYWVLGRVLMRASTTISLPKIGNTFDMSLLFEQYAINHGLSDTLFTVKNKTEVDD
jgi:hypothetical protein